MEVDTQKLQDITSKLNAEKNPSHISQSNIVLALSALALDTVKGHDNIDLLKGILSALVATAKHDHSEVQLHSTPFDRVNNNEISLSLSPFLSLLSPSPPPPQSPSLLPFFLYLQSITQNPQFKVSILHSIPSLATHRLATISIVSTIQALGATPSLLPLAIRLMDRLWQQQDHVFPFLSEMLSRVLPPSLPAQLVYEVTLARAIVVRDVCQLK